MQKRLSVKRFFGTNSFLRREQLLAELVINLIPADLIRELVLISTSSVNPGPDSIFNTPDDVVRFPRRSGK